MKVPYMKLIVACVAVAGIVALTNSNIKLRKQRERLERNQSALLSSIEFYRIDSAKNVASIQQLRLTKEELESSNSSLLSDIEALKIKLKRVNSASSVTTESKYEIQTQIKDSIVYRDSIIYRYKCIDYHTPYLILQGCVVSPTEFVGVVQTFDSITRIEHRVPKKFLFFNCGTKLVKEEYVSKNPHTVITNVETVTIVDKKGKRKDK